MPLRAGYGPPCSMTSCLCGCFFLCCLCGLLLVSQQKGSMLRLSVGGGGTASHSVRRLNSTSIAIMTSLSCRAVVSIFTPVCAQRADDYFLSLAKAAAIAVSDTATRRGNKPTFAAAPWPPDLDIAG